MLQRVRRSPFISIMCDESTDISNSKKLILYARILDPETFVATTHFMSNISVGGSTCTAENIFSLIMKYLHNKEIDISKVIGFGSDGAAVMTGSKTGVATRFKEKSPHLISIHCMAHRLNLCTSKASNGIPYLREFEAIFTELYRYFDKSSNREAELKEIQKILDGSELKIREVHEIRWLAFFDALTAVFRSYKALAAYFKKQKKSKVCQDMLVKITDYRFVAFLHIMMDIIPNLAQLCLLLQKCDLDIATVKPAIQNTLSTVKKVDKGKTHYQKMMQEKCVTTTSNDKQKLSFSGIDLNIHRSTLQKARDDVASLRKEFTSQLTAQISSRFPVESQNMADAFEVLGLRNLSQLTVSEAESYGTEKIHQLSNHFGSEKNIKGVKSPPIIDSVSIVPEWNLAKVVIKRELYPRSNMQGLWKIMHEYHKDTFPNLLRLASIALVMPYQTADCERGFSAQNQTKNKLRNKLEEKTLLRLMMIKLEGPPLRSFDFDKAVNLWKRKKDRRVFAKH